MPLDQVIKRSRPQARENRTGGITPSPPRPRPQPINTLFKPSKQTAPDSQLASQRRSAPNTAKKSVVILGAVVVVPAIARGGETVGILGSVAQRGGGAALAGTPVEARAEAEGGGDGEAEGEGQGEAVVAEFGAEGRVGLLFGCGWDFSVQDDCGLFVWRLWLGWGGGKCVFGCEGPHHGRMGEKVSQVTGSFSALSRGYRDEFPMRQPHLVHRGQANSG